MKMPLDYITL